MKRTLSVILALLLCCCTALSESVYDFVVRQGFEPVSKDINTKILACYFEEKNDKCAITWSDGDSQFRVIQANQSETMKALYTKMLSMAQWQRCQFIVNGKRLFGFNAPKKALNKCSSLENYKNAITFHVYGITPKPKNTPTPRPTSTPRPTIKPRPTPKPTVKPAKKQNSDSGNYVLNTKTHKFHRPSCSDIKKMKAKNREDVYASRQEIINWGYSPCKHCKP